MRSCNQMLVLCFLVLILCPASIGEELKESVPLRLEIKADKEVYASGEPIHIDLKIMNVGKADLGSGKNHLAEKDGSLYVFLPKRIYVSLILEGKDRYTLGAGSIALDDNTMEKLLAGKFEPLEKEDFISIPPGYFYGRRFDIPAEANVQGKLTCSYSNKLYSGNKAGIAAWRGAIKSNVLNIRFEEKEKASRK